MGSRTPIYKWVYFESRSDGSPIFAAFMVRGKRYSKRFKSQRLAANWVAKIKGCTVKSLEINYLKATQKRSRRKTKTASLRIINLKKAAGEERVISGKELGTGVVE